MIMRMDSPLRELIHTKLIETRSNELHSTTTSVLTDTWKTTHCRNLVAG